jgi:hypothetical protein
MVQGRLPIWVAVWATAVALLLVGASGASASIYFGATISGEPYGQTGFAPSNQSAWHLFERHAGKKVAIVGQNQTWCAFDTSEMNATSAGGAIPLVTMGLDGTLAEVAAGKQDAAIKQWAAAAKAYGRPFLFAPWWEMNGTWYSWGRSPDFVAAWRHFHDLVVAQGATNVTWTWIPNSIWAEDANSNPSPYYPGDAYVDWVGFDSYNWGLNPIQPAHWTTPNQTYNPTLKIVKELAPTKPIVIAETASSELGGNKADWIREAFATYMPRHPEIKAFVWFNWNFPQNGERADWPIESSSPAQQEFRKQMQSSLYRGGPVSLPTLTKVPPPTAGAADPPAAADISAAGETASGPRVAVAPDGSATVAWSAREGGKFGVWERRIGTGGTAPPVLLSDPARDALDPQLALAADGTATVAWIGSDGTSTVVQARRISPTGTVGATTATLSAGGRDAAAPKVAIGPDGSATIVWKRFNGSDYLVEERRLMADASLVPGSGPNVLSAPGGSAVEADVATAEDGSSLVAWSRFNGTASIVEARSLNPAGSPGASTLQLSAETDNAIEPRVAIAPDRTATVVWTRSGGAGWMLERQRLSPAGALAGGAQALSAPGGDAVEPQLAVAADGELTATWDRFDGSSFVAQARRVDPLGNPGPVLGLSVSGRDAAEPQLSVAADGTSTVLWSQYDATESVIERRDVAGDETLSPLEALSAAGGRASAPAVAWGSDGTLGMTWRRFAGAGDVIQARLLTPPPPPPPPPPGEDSPSGATTGAAGSAKSTSGSSAKGTAAGIGSLRVEKVILNRKRGTATLKVWVPARGGIALKGAAPRSRAVGAAGTVALKVVPRAAQRRQLEARGRLPLKVTVSFRPAAGGTLSQPLTVRLRFAR